MPLIKLSEARTAGQTVKRSKAWTNVAKSLHEEAKNTPERETFQIFLSHSFLDAETVLGLRQILMDLGYTVYVDWVEDAQLDRTQVSTATAGTLRKRMQNSECLFFATSPNSPKSKWMPWELGYFDGAKMNRVAICPLNETETETSAYAGQEYLGLYPYVDRAKADKSEKIALWISWSPAIYVNFDQWLKGADPSDRSQKT